jgi:hypothetical protein
MCLRSQFIKLLKKVRSNEAGSRRFYAIIEPLRREVVNTSEEIISQEIAI